jgi:hypothetical protein
VESSVVFSVNMEYGGVFRLHQPRTHTCGPVLWLRPPPRALRNGKTTAIHTQVSRVQKNLLVESNAPK